MSLNVQVSEDGRTVTIKIMGHFRHEMHVEFRDAYENAPVKVGEPNFVIDLMETDTLDSSALGMLLLLREHVGGDRSRVLIKNCDKVTKEVFDIANFDKLFTIDVRDSA